MNRTGTLKDTELEPQQKPKEHNRNPKIKDPQDTQTITPKEITQKLYNNAKKYSSWQGRCRTIKYLQWWNNCRLNPLGGAYGS